jgi:hypothetical protein
VVVEINLKSVRETSTAEKKNKKIQINNKTINKYNNNYNKLKIRKNKLILNRVLVVVVGITEGV